MGISIGELAATAGVNASAVRYYEQAGLIATPGRRSGRRVYDANAVRDLAFITRARSASFRIAEIGQLITLMRSQNPLDESCQQAKVLARLKVKELENQIEQATRLRRQLLSALEVDCSGLDECSVISGSGPLASPANAA